jgi:hypothetical protein
VGIRNAELAQILSGISVNDPVITSGGYALPDSTKIKVEAPGAAEKDAGDKGDEKAEEKAGDKAKPAAKEKE